MRTRFAFFLTIILAGFALALMGSGGTPGVEAAQPTLLPFITPSSTPFPVIVDTRPTATSAAPGCVLLFPITLGDVITINSGVNLRARPNISAPSLAYYQEKRDFLVVDGPICANDYYWWLVTGHGTSGWVAQGTSGENFVLLIMPGPDAPILCETPLFFQRNEQVQVTYNVRLRREPSLSALVDTVVPFEGYVTILNPEPICADGINWWNVRSTVAGFTYEGWIAQGSASNSAAGDTFVELTPPPNCSVPMRAIIGDQGRVRYVDRTPKSLRTAPGLDGELLFTLVEGVPVEIIGGPVCEDGLNWWQIRVLGNFQPEGWLAEGSRPNYWIRITNDIGPNRLATQTALPTIPGASTITPTPVTFTPVPTVTATPAP